MAFEKVKIDHDLKWHSVTNPLPEPMLTYYPIAFLFHKQDQVINHLNVFGKYTIKITATFLKSLYYGSINTNEITSNDNDF